LTGIPGEWRLYAATNDAEGVASEAVAPALGTPEPVEELSIREREVMRLVAEGLSNEEIAERLVLSIRTVERPLSNVYVKLRVSGKSARTAGAGRFARLAEP